MRIFKYHAFSRWAYCEDLTDEVLKKAVAEIEKGLYEVNLGSGLYKKRVAKKRQGKRGSYQMLLAFKDGEKAFFIYGFAKNVLSNVTDNKKKLYRRLAKDFLGMNAAAIKKMVNNGKLYEMKQ